MTDASQAAARPNAAVLPVARVLLERTDWAALEHALGPAADIPGALRQLIDDDVAVRARAFSVLQLINHQNSIYSATAPAALYIAATLPDPRVAATINVSYHGGQSSRPMRAVLLDWLGDMAGDVGDEAAVSALGRGFRMDSQPEIVALRVARPAIFRAVAAFLEDDNLDVRQAAITAAAQLVDAPALLHRRAALAAPLRVLLATSSSRYHRVRTKQALLSWGEDPVTLTEFVNPAECTGADPLSCCQEPEPPF